MGWLMFPDKQANSPPALRDVVQKHGIFPSIEMLDAFRYGKNQQPLRAGWIFQTNKRIRRPR